MRSRCSALWFVSLALTLGCGAIGYDEVSLGSATVADGGADAAGRSDDGGGEAHAADTGPVDGATATDSTTDGPGVDSPIDAGVDSPEPDAPVDAAPVPIDAPVLVDASVDLTIDQRPLSSGGAACKAGTECSSGFCADEICCDTACTGTCSACNLPGTKGICKVASFGDDPRDQCLAEPDNPCGGIGVCDGKGACARQGKGTLCGPAACIGSAQTIGRCDGQGTCQQATERDCGRFACDDAGQTCRQSCSQMSHCASGYVCNPMGGCDPKRTGAIAYLEVNDGDLVRRLYWSIQVNFQIGALGSHPWGDWPNTYVFNIDSGALGLLGKEWIKVASESKKYAAGPQATVLLNGTHDVYMFVDDRWGPGLPAWTAGWTYTGWKATMYESAGRPSLPFSIARKSAQTGSVSLPAIGGTAGYNYLIVVD